MPLTPRMHPTKAQLRGCPAVRRFLLPRPREVVTSRLGGGSGRTVGARCLSAACPSGTLALAQGASTTRHAGLDLGPGGAAWRLGRRDWSDWSDWCDWRTDHVG